MLWLETSCFKQGETSEKELVKIRTQCFTIISRFRISNKTNTGYIIIPLRQFKTIRK